MDHLGFGVHAGPHALRQLLDAVLSIGSDLELSSVLVRIAEAATDLVEARYGALGVLDEGGTRLSEFITVGIDAAGRKVIGDLPQGHGILGLLIVDPKPLRLPNLGEHPDSYGFPPNHPTMTSFLGVPIRVRDQVFGNLYLCNRRGQEVFSDVDEEMAIALAAAAAIAIDQARLHARIGELALYEDRDRIARDLHDRVIQRLFATGLNLQGLTKADLPPEVVDRLNRAIDDLDETVHQVRSTIFELHTARLPGRSVRQQVWSVCSDSSPTLGFEPVVRFDGPIDSLVEDSVADHLLAVLREALANVARHASATAVEVSITARADQLHLTVIDDGVGITEDGGTGHGLSNMRERAARLNGTVTIERSARGGTSVQWVVTAATT